MQGQQQVVTQQGQPQAQQQQQQLVGQQGNVVVKMNDAQVPPLSSVAFDEADGENDTYDNLPHLPFGQIEPIPMALGINADVLPLVFSTILPSPFCLFRIISFSGRHENDNDTNARLRVLVYNDRLTNPVVSDVGYRFISLTVGDDPNKVDEDRADETNVRSTVRDYEMSMLMGPNSCYCMINNECGPQAHPSAENYPIIFPGTYLEVRGSLNYVSQFHIRSIYPKTWPPQQNRHNNDIFNGFFHYTIGTPIKPGHCFVFTFRPFNNKGGIGIQLKAGPYRQTPLQMFGHFNSGKPMEITGTDDEFEYKRTEHSKYFPFHFDSNNYVAILMGTDKFVIAINGKLFHKFKYCQKKLPEEITDLKINCLDGTLVHCSRFDNSFIPIDQNSDEQIVKFAHPTAYLDQKFYEKYYGSLY